MSRICEWHITMLNAHTHNARRIVYYYARINEIPLA